MAGAKPQHIVDHLLLRGAIDLRQRVDGVGYLSAEEDLRAVCIRMLIARYVASMSRSTFMFRGWRGSVHVEIGILRVIEPETLPLFDVNGTATEIKVHFNRVIGHLSLRRCT